MHTLHKDIGGCKHVTMVDIVNTVWWYSLLDYDGYIAYFLHFAFTITRIIATYG